MRCSVSNIYIDYKNFIGKKAVRLVLTAFFQIKYYTFFQQFELRFLRAGLKMLFQKNTSVLIFLSSTLTKSE